MKRRGHTAGNADARYAGIVAGCDTRTALTSLKLIETRGGLELALEMEKAMQARSSVMGAINQRLLGMMGEREPRIARMSRMGGKPHE